jgi:hypothetical protein
MTASKLILHPKVAAGGIAGALSVCVVYVVGHYVSVPPEVASAVTVIVGGVAGYFAPWINKVQPK